MKTDDLLTWATKWLEGFTLRIIQFSVALVGFVYAIELCSLKVIEAIKAFVLLPLGQ